MRTSYLAVPYDGYVGFDRERECRVTIPGGYLVFLSAAAEPGGVSYVRLMDDRGIE
jgi:hypothetical protein